MDFLDSTTSSNYHVDWDSKKAERNLRKHDISFLEAATVFMDPLAMTLEDSRHEERRFHTLGLSSRHRLLLVVHSVVEETVDGWKIRIISARRATRRESRFYENE